MDIKFDRLLRTIEADDYKRLLNARHLAPGSHQTKERRGIPMLRKISTFPLAAYLAVTGIIRDFKKDERGLSGVVVAIMLILIAVLAIVLIWGFLSGWLKELWDNITGQAASIQ